MMRTGDPPPRRRLRLAWSIALVAMLLVGTADLPARASGYAYSGIWQGNPVTLTWISVHSPTATASVSAADAERLGQLRDFQTDAPRYSCLDGHSFIVWSAPAELGSEYVAWYAGASPATSTCDTYVALAFSPSIAGGGSGAAPALSPFSDLAGVPWAEPQIALLRAQDVVAGVSATRYQPGGVLTAEQAVTLLSRLFLPAGSPGPSPPEAGVDTWAQAAVAWAQANGVIRQPSTFEPTMPAPRARVAAWVVRALGLSCQCSPQADLRFSDAAAIPPAYPQGVTVAYVDGLFVGDAQNDFHPAEPITRAQMAVVLVRAEEALAERGGASAPLTWSASATGQAPVTWQGSAMLGSATLPVGAIQAGKLSFQGPDGSATESFLRWNGAGAGTVAIAGTGQVQSGRFGWHAGTLWLIPGPGTLSYSGSTAGGSLSFRSPVSSCGSGCTESYAGTYRTATSGGVETAGFCSSGCLQYTGPTLPGPVLVLTGSDVTGLWITAANGSGG